MISSLQSNSTLPSIKDFEASITSKLAYLLTHRAAISFTTIGALPSLASAT